MHGDPTGAVQLAAEAMAAADQQRDVALGGAARRTLGNAYICGGNFAAALPVLIEGLDAARRTRNREDEIGCLNGIGVALMRLGDFDGATEHLHKALALTDAHADPLARMSMYANLANVCAEIEDFARAVEFAQRALDAVGDDRGRVARMNLGAYLARTGAVAEARDHLQRALDAMRRAGDRTGEARALAILGEVELDALQPEAAAQALNAALAVARSAGAPHSEANVLHLLGRLAAQAGATDDSERLLLQALALAEWTQEVRTQKRVHATLADVYEHSGSLARALFHLRESHRVERDYYQSMNERRAQALLVRMRVSEAQREAHAQRIRNLELMEANRRIAARDATAHARTRAAAQLRNFGLSERELRVLAQLGRGATNPQIADALGLSPYTVRDHVSVILNKLGVATRTEAAALAVRNGWV